MSSRSPVLAGADQVPVLFDAIVLTGGQGRRLGGVSKADLQVRGVPLVVSALATAADARRIVVVGPPTAHHPAELTTREDPAGGGPAAGLAAGLRLLRRVGETPPAPWTLLLACDSPDAAGALPLLVQEADGSTADVVMAVDGGHRQPLLALYRTTQVQAVLADLVVDGTSMRSVVGNLRVDTVEVPAGTARDIDTWDDYAEMNRRSSSGPGTA